ncbi:MAG: class I SAM-dependent methyltransferase, partial [Methanobrevibacter sp.]|nr:class I SAM-dependent methyltransferase [Methanobrevibacter sp.]
MGHYNDNFYEIHEKGSLKSSKEILPLIMNLIEPNTVIDVGCGVGTWLSTFESLGVKKILGIDGDHVNREKLYINKDNFLVANLENIHGIREKDNQINKFDLAMSLEVAEHLSENVAHDFIEYLTSKSDIVLFSAAVPGQGGTHHINEQWPEYWIKIFKENGFEVVD